MSRKKQLTYNDMSRAIREMQVRQEQERNRMAQVMAISLLNGGAAAILGDCPDADLRRIMAFVADDIGTYVDRLNAEKKARQTTVTASDMTVGFRC